MTDTAWCGLVCLELRSGEVWRANLLMALWLKHREGSRASPSEESRGVGKSKGMGAACALTRAPQGQEQIDPASGRHVDDSRAHT